MASFVRQLNMYGFRKLSCIDQGGMHCYKNEIEFYHQYFIKGQESLLELIKRKIPSSKSEEPKVKQEYVEELVSNLQTLQGKQDKSEKNVKTLLKQNELLWRHVEVLTARYNQQQNAIKQMYPFFMNFIHSSRDLAIKRKASLMIDEGDTHNKVARLSPQYFVQMDDQDEDQDVPVSPGNVTNRGPVIHDVTEMESSKMYPGTVLCSSNSTTTKDCEVIVDSALSNSLESSEKTIDSPFTEPGSMETLNILNQNFERRSRSSSFGPAMEIKHSSPRASSSSTRRRSPPLTSRYVSSSISPIVIIDETTSDVAVSDNMMTSSFVPKIEDTCSDSGFYSMSSMMSEKISPVIDEETISILTAASPPLINGNSSIANGSSLLANLSTSLRNVTSSMSPSMENGSPPLSNESPLKALSGSPPMSSRSPPIGNGNPPMSRSPPMTNGGPSMSTDALLSMSNGRPSISNGMPSLSNGGPSISNGMPSLSNGGPSISNGMSSLSNESPSVSNGMLSISNGAPTISNVLSSMSNGSASMNSGVPAMSNGGPAMVTLNPLRSGELPSMTNGGPLISNDISSMRNRSASMSSGSVMRNGNKYNTYMMNVKRDAPDANWMMNQASSSYPSESNLESWFGVLMFLFLLQQIMKTDNLTPGCSLPQTQAVGVNYV
ncbi:heat shock factor protein [Caerostris extrusa]|uniref:Heat shock factor protein n=1 Tax=Caerostris extrusa TaxID=172846 RepID=A0AAV4YDG3_CAEEX|nr:heat shock factor protein [Caerostris extrusa]